MCYCPHLFAQSTSKKKLYKKQSLKLMWVLGFFIWYLLLTIQLSKFIKCNYGYSKKMAIFSELWQVFYTLLEISSS